VVSSEHMLFHPSERVPCIQRVRDLVGATVSTGTVQKSLFALPEAESQFFSHPTHSPVSIPSKLSRFLENKGLRACINRRMWKILLYVARSVVAKALCYKPEGRGFNTR
jgi:hypothetical protein